MVPNPLKSLQLLLERDTALVLGVSAVFYMSYYIVQASLPVLFMRAYGLTTTQVGLCYLPMGFDVIIGGYINDTPSLTHQ